MNFDLRCTLGKLITIRPFLCDSVTFLEETIGTVCELTDPTACILAGSVASNTQDAYSDVDIFLVTDITTDDALKSDILEALTSIETVCFVNHTDLLFWMPNLFSIYPKARGVAPLDISVCTKATICRALKYLESPIQIWPEPCDIKTQNNIAMNALSGQEALTDRLDSIPYEVMHICRKLVKAYRRNQFNFAIMQLERLRNICAELILFSRYGDEISKDMIYRPLKYITDDDLGGFLYCTVSYRNLINGKLLCSVAEEFIDFIRNSLFLSNSSLWSCVKIDW